ncbi:conserved protein of unknown function [Paraburkholderia kururiensis]
MTRIDFIVGVVGVLTSVGAAVFWLWSSLIEVPDNIDTFIGELQRIGRMNARGAMCACVGAICGAYAFARGLGWI